MNDDAHILQHNVALHFETFMTYALFIRIYLLPVTWDYCSGFILGNLVLGIVK